MWEDINEMGGWAANVYLSLEEVTSQNILYILGFPENLQLDILHVLLSKLKGEEG